MTALGIKTLFSSLGTAMAMRQAFKKIGHGFLVFGGLVLALTLHTGEVRGEDDFTSAVQIAKASGVSEELINQILIVGYRYNLKSKDLAGFLVIATEAGKRRIPVEPLVDKMEEGLAKRVQTIRIEQVLRQDLVQYSLVQALLEKTVFTKGYQGENVKSGDVVRLARTLSMGISENEMQALLSDAPRVSIEEIVDAVEFTAALKQAGEAFAEAREITVAGLQSGFFARTAWALPLMVSAAKRHHLSEDKIKAAALEVVEGKKTVLEAHTGLGLDPKSLGRGPVVSAAPSGSGKGANTGKSQTGAAGQGGQGSGGNGVGGGAGVGGGPGGTGAGGPGGGPGGGGAGGGPGGGGGGPGR
jgi:hypothetical protein